MFKNDCADFKNVLIEKQHSHLQSFTRVYFELQEEGTRDKTVKLLLRHGADVNLTDDFGRTALSYVCERRCNDILRILVKEHNIDPDIQDINGG